MKIKKFFNVILDAIFPKNITCISCNAELQNDAERKLCICAPCQGKLVYIGDKTQEIANKELGFSEFVTVYAYEGVARSIIIGYKDNNKPYLGEYIANFLINEFNKSKKKVDLVTFVPSSKDKVAQRGFDPMKIVADFFSKGTSIKIVDILSRKSKHKDQTESDDRYENIKGQFAIKNCDIKGKTILLIDDVVTTGATAAECSNLLVKNGAKKVVLLAFSEAKSFNSYKNKTMKRMENHRLD